MRWNFAHLQLEMIAFSGGYKSETAPAAQQGCLPQHHHQGGRPLETAADTGAACVQK